jgi:hypothetical protein
VEAGLLDDRADTRQRSAALLGDGQSEEPHRSGAGLRQAEQHSDQRCLARAVRAEEAERGAAGDAEIEVRERRALPEALCQALHFNR